MNKKNQTLTKDLIQDAPYRVLGTVEGENAVIQNCNRHVFVRPFESLLTSKTLIALAPMRWWMDKAGEGEMLSPRLAERCGDVLIREAERIGEVEMDRFIGRGAAKVGGEMVYHLGDRVLVYGDEPRKEPVEIYGESAKVVPLENREGWILLPRPPIAFDIRPGAHDDNIGCIRHEFAEAVMQYRWKNEAHGRRYLGWLVSSIIGGALEWRPHLWICEEGEAGKSWLVKNTAQPLFGEFYRAGASVSPAALVNKIKSDALPYIMEEAEPDDSFVEQSLPILRIAAGEDGEHIRADQRGGVRIQRPRFSAAVLSTKLPKLNIANRSRFAFVEFGERTENAEWLEVAEGIKRATTHDKMMAIRRQIILDAPTIVEMAERATARLLRDYNASSRAAMIGGALVAGCEYLDCADRTGEQYTKTGETNIGWALENGGKRPDTNAEAFEVLTRITDAETGGGRTLGELMRKGEARPLGIYVQDGRLIVATSHTAIERALRATQFNKVDIGALLLRIPDAERTSNALRFGGSRHRAISIPTAAVSGVVDTGDD